MPVLHAENLSKSYGPQVLFDDATLTLRQGERVGLVGVNGSGKSTLARVLAGLEPVDSGTLSRRRGATIEYLEQRPDFDPNRTAREIVVEGLAAWSEARARYDEIAAALAKGGGDVEALLAAQAEAEADIERLGGWGKDHQVDAMLGHLGIHRPDDPVGTFSGGEQRRVALARILLAEPSLAILDEPTNHLDVETIDWLEGFLLNEYRGAILLITHDRYLLDRVATRTLELDRGKVYAYDGGYEDYLEAKAERLAHAARVEQNRQNFLRRELDWLRRQPKARGTKQKARIERAEEAMAQRAPRAERVANLALETSRSGKTILELRGVSIERYGRNLVRGLDLYLTEGERIGIVGRNGAGKTTLLRALLGEIPPSKGQVVIGQNTKFAYFDQGRSGLDEKASILENVSEGHAKIDVFGEPIDPRAYLERFLFDPDKQRTPVAALSGGERARVALAKLLRHRANVVVLDEPTNDLDVATLGALEQMLVESGATALVVTHDRYFLDRVATSILAFEGDGKVVCYPGNYEAYLRLRAQSQSEPATEKPTEPATDAKAKRPKQQKALTYREEKELEGILGAIEEAETKVADLEAKLSDPGIYADGDKVRDLMAALEAAKIEANRLVARWEELEAKKEAAKA